MHQLHRARPSAHGGQCGPLLEGAQALRDELPRLCDADLDPALHAAPLRQHPFEIFIQNPPDSADRRDQEPDRSEIEVAIAAVEAVFDWRKWEREKFPEESGGAL